MLLPKNRTSNHLPKHPPTTYTRVRLITVSYVSTFRLRLDLLAEKITMACGVPVVFDVYLHATHLRTDNPLKINQIHSFC